MEYTNLGTAGVKVSRICLGTAFRAGPDDATCLATIDRAIDQGINFIDCANAYGRGRSESLLGQALQGRRDRVVLTTKVRSAMGEGPNDSGLSRVHIMRQVEDSLQRLQTDYIDLYLAHSVDPETPIEETLRAFDDLVRQGKVRYTGCSNYPAWQVCKALWISDRRHQTAFACCQEHFNLLDRRIERELVPLCLAEGLGLMTYSAVAVGLLTGQYRRGQTPPAHSLWARREQHLQKLLTPETDRVIEAVCTMAAAHDKTPAQVAIAWVLSRPGISAAMVGPDAPEHVDDAVGACGWTLSQAELHQLDELSAWAVAHGQVI